MYHIAICDDNFGFVSYIEKLLIHRVGIHPNEVKFHKFNSGEEMIRSFRKNIPFNLLILDMQLKELDGDATAREFRKKYPNTLLVFCSGVCHPTVKSFEARAFRYLLKEYNSDRMTTEFQTIIQEMKRIDSIPRIPISFRNKTIFVLSSEILYCGIRKHGSNVYVFDRFRQQSQCLICNKTLLGLFSELSKFSFACIHNSYFVNLEHVIAVSNHEVKLIDGTILTISRSKEKEFKELLATYLAKKY